MNVDARIRDAFRDACILELAALKPGNVHRFAGGHGMTVEDFGRSARVAAPPLAGRSVGLGRRIRRAVEATRAAVAQNTNLGILLLCAPIAEASIRHPGDDLAKAVHRVLQATTVEDCREVYRAIRIARPAGLGHSPRHDVRDEPEVDLRTAMEAARSRDRIAWNYVHDLADVFGYGLARLDALRQAGWHEGGAITGLYLGFLARFPDSHVARKSGRRTAERLRAEAERILARFETASPGSDLEWLLDFDRTLKRQALNPGTCADLTVATLFANILTERKIVAWHDIPSVSGR